MEVSYVSGMIITLIHGLCFNNILWHITAVLLLFLNTVKRIYVGNIIDFLG